MAVLADGGSHPQHGAASAVVTGPKRTLVLGLGNSILSDDGVGLAVARHVRQLLSERRTGVEVAESATGGLDLIELLSGYDRAILVDAIDLPGGEPGTVLRLTPEALPSTVRLTCSHEVDLATALDLGRALSLGMPAEVVVWVVQVEDATTLNMCLNPRVAAAVGATATLIVREVLYPEQQPCTTTRTNNEEQRHNVQAKESAYYPNRPKGQPSPA